MISESGQDTSRFILRDSGQDMNQGWVKVVLALLIQENK